jgi:hypothetical protein
LFTYSLFVFCCVLKQGGIACHHCGSWWRGGDTLFDALDTFGPESTLSGPESTLSGPESTLQGPGKSWGRVLDAGTGSLSLPLVANRSAGNCTAVTASQAMLNSLASQNEGPLTCQLVVGLWSDETFLEGEVSCSDVTNRLFNPKAITNRIPTDYGLSLKG